MTDLMLAAQYPTSGVANGELAVVEIPRPRPAHGEVLVRVRLAGVNPTDWKTRAGLSPAAAAHVVPGQDGAGEIGAVGAGVDPARVGERVWLWEGQWGRSQGTSAQWISLPEAQAVRLPPEVSFEHGAALGIPAITAHRCLFADGPLAGESVLVHGGAGAVGHAAIELARWHGARVAATVSSPEKAELARAAGADLVVNYRREDLVGRVRAWAPDGVARVVDVDLPANLELNTELLAPGGAISTYTASGMGMHPGRSLMTLNAVLRYVFVYTIPEAAKRAAVADISQALHDGALTPLPEHRFPLTQTHEAHRAVESGAVGKVLIEIP